MSDLSAMIAALNRHAFAMIQEEKRNKCKRCAGTGWQPVQEPVGALLRDVPGVKERCPCMKEEISHA